MKIKSKKIIIKLVLIFVLLTLFFFILNKVLQQDIDAFDKCIYDLIPKNDVLTPIMKGFTFMGEPLVLITFTVLSLLFIKDKKVAICIPVNLGIVALINQSIKFLISRPRPEGINLIEISGYSFPSGHTMSAMAFYGLLIYFLYKKGQNKSLKWIAIALLSFLIVMIGISRIYLGVHFASDVFAGLFLSLSYLIIFSEIYKIYVEEVKNENNK